MAVEENWTCVCGYENPVGVPDCGSCEREREAAEYAVLLLSRYGRVEWREHTRCPTKGEAIEQARKHLGNSSKAACVQGRGTDERPTPTGEVLVFRGVARGYSASALFPMLYPKELSEVEVVG